MIGKSNYSIRFAPSTTGYAHPGTLLSGLLCWLEARSTGARFILRLENLDPERCKTEFEDAMIRDLAWLGLDWDEVVFQSQNMSQHECALDALALAGRLYPCSCSRSRIKELNRLAPDGGFAYDNQCRGRKLPPGGWRESQEPLRLLLDDERIDFVDLAGHQVTQRPARDMGDPVVRRRDGAIAYHLACVADDHHSGVKTLIRGRDLLTSAPIQMLMQRMLGYEKPAYRHHLLFLEQHGGKLAKFHGAVGAPELKKYYRAEELCGEIAFLCGLQRAPDPATPAHLLKTFKWTNVKTEDVAVRWDGKKLLPLLIPGR